MDTSDTIAAVAAAIALLALVPTYLSWRIARNELTKAADDAKTAKDQVIAARQQAAAAWRQVGALQDSVEVARKQQAAAERHAIAAAQSAGAAEATLTAQSKRLLFDVDRALAESDEVHVVLRSNPAQLFNGGEADEAVWVRVERYMGTFERIQVLVEAGTFLIGLVEELYGYRVSNLVQHEAIYREKLVKRADGWSRFIKLWHDLDEASRQRRGRPLSKIRSLEQREQDELEVKRGAASASLISQPES